jgi:hypothetical protein
MFSGIIKMYPIEPFEVLLTDAGIANWNIAPYLARILISFEITLGFLIIINFSPKVVLRLSLITLIVFCIYLLYTIFFRKDISDCGCYGTYISLSPLQSLIKNIILFVWSFYLLLNAGKGLVKLKWLLCTIIIITSIVYPMIINPPDSFFDYSLRKDRIGEKIDLNTFGDTKFNDGIHPIDSGRVVLAFLSLRCKFCRYAAMKLAIISREQTKPIPLYFVFWDLSSNQALIDFHKRTKSEKVPYKLLPEEKFLSLSGGNLPAIFFLENGIIRKKTGFRDMNPVEVIDFLKL